MAALLLAAAPSVTATASKAEVSVGETFTVEVRADGPPGSTFVFPPELSGETAQLTAEPGQGTVRRYRAAIFALEDAEVPPIAVRYRLPDGTAGEVATAALPLRVSTLLPKDKDEQKLADVRPPVRLDVARLFWIAMGAVAAVLLGLAVWLWWRRRRRAAPEAPPVPALSPGEEASRALDALAASGRLDRGEFRPFYIELTAIAKRYLERRLTAPILEMTTSEMLAYLRQQPLTSESGPLLRDLSGAADRIKFAKGSGLAEEGERHLQAVRALVEALEARLAPSAAADGGKAA
ncbi:MAG TPA: hypothetical protein VFV75_17790 [Candidatus Polarisedimenticolaceae bacterium]|nr:hypothetical protein [Candidatus Polarisedimenticolaceae bacterium]